MNSFYQNPFHILGVAPRENRQRIIELSEEKSLTMDSDICDKARSDLTNLRVRVAAEIAWLPGLSPKCTTELINILQVNPHLIRKQNLSALVKANLLGAAFGHLDPAMSTDDWVQWILDLAYAIEEIDLEDAMKDINEDRYIAKLTEIKSLSVLEDEFATHRRNYQEAVVAALNRLTTLKLVDIITQAVEVATELGNKSAPSLLKDLIEGDYQSKTRKFIENEAENVSKFVDLIRKSAPKGEEAVTALLDRMEPILRKWDKVAQPIQVVMKSSGNEHDVSQKMAYEIRQLGIELYNQHGMLNIATRITQILQEVFAELPEVVEKLDKDSETLVSLSAQRERIKRQEQKWQDSITFKTEIGLIFKQTLSISPSGVRWKDISFTLEKVTRVRWGAVKHSINGIPTGTEYTICFGDNSRLATVVTQKQPIFESFIDKLWRAVGVRLITEMLEGLRRGQSYRIGDALISDHGAEINKSDFFSSSRVYGNWSELKVWSANGSFFIGMNSDKKAYSELSYIGTDNTHIIEAAIRMKLKNGSNKLSDILEK
jgi:hypothetical protein